MKVSDCCLVEITGSTIFCPECGNVYEPVETCDDCGELLKECTCDNDPKIFSLVDQVYMPEKNKSND